MSLRIAGDTGADYIGADDEDFLPIEYDDGRPAFTIVLLGYRNDLSRHAVLALLRDRIEDGPPDPPLPYTVAERIDGVNGARLVGELEDAGAIVSFTAAPPRIVGKVQPPAEETVDVAPSEPRPAQTAEYPKSLAQGVTTALPPRHVRIAALLAFGAYLVFLQVQAQQERLLASAAPHVAPRLAPRSLLDRPQPLVPATAQRVRRLITAGRLDDAREVVDGNPRPADDALAVALRGEIELASGDWRKARSTLEIARDLGNRDPEMLVALASTYRRQGDRRAAADMLQQAQQHGARGTAFEKLRQLVAADEAAQALSLDEPRPPAMADTLADPPS